MNHRALLVFALLSSTVGLYAVYGKNFFMFKPSFEFNDPERLIILDAGEEKALFDVTIFGGKTSQSQDIARYFLPVDKSCIRITEDGSPNMHGCDVTAAFMDIITEPIIDKTAAQIGTLVSDMTYDATVNFCPQRAEIGVGFALKYSWQNACWLSLATSVVQLRNNLNICENTLDVGGNGPADDCGYKSFCAFVGAGCPTWNYGKFCGGCLKKTGVPEVEIAFGHDVDHADVGKTGGFLGLIIPTGTKVDQRYLFAPIVGNGRHFGLFGGIDGQYVLATGQNVLICLVPSGLIRYLIPHQEQRSFDLKWRPWSRYMWVWLDHSALENPAVGANVTSALQHMAPLVNYSTLCVDVSPGWSADVNVGLQFAGERTAFELGYHGYAREAEDICFCCANMTNERGLQAFTRYLGDWEVDDHLPTTRSFNAINSPVFSASHYLVDYAYAHSLPVPTYAPVTLDSLDLDSARTPATLAQTLYVLLSHQFASERVPVALRLGASYTFASDNSYPCGWKAWGALTFAF